MDYGDNTVKSFLVTIFIFQFLADQWGHKPSDISPQAGGLLDDGGADIEPFVVGHQEYGLNILVQLSVHKGQLKFVFKIRQRSEAPYNYIFSLEWKRAGSLW